MKDKKKRPKDQKVNKTKKSRRPEGQMTQKKKAKKKDQKVEKTRRPKK
jgi:hypothetical protein